MNSGVASVMASSRPLKKTKKQKTLEESLGLHALPKETQGASLDSPSPATMPL